MLSSYHFPLQRRLSDDLREKIEQCSGNCKTQVCKRRCELRYTFKHDHLPKLRECYGRCGEKDAYCNYACFYREVGLTPDEIWKQYNANKVGIYCQTTELPDQCLAEALAIPEQSVIDSTDCRETSCAEADSMLAVANCELNCQSALIEPLLQSNYSLIIDRHKNKDRVKNAANSNLPSLLYFSLSLLVFSLLF